MSFEEIYEVVCGFRVGFDNSELNLFSHNQKCSQLYREIYLARERLEKRLNTFEDEDILIIVSCYEEMQKLVAEKIFRYARLN